jgi:molybdopterin-guanine dinucleotide biosynthesis protein A
MGQDKSKLPFQGTTLLEWTARRVAHLSDDVLVIANQPEVTNRIPYPVYPDVVPGRGPLGGLHAALTYARHEIVACLACDMPFANPTLLSEESRLLAAQDVDVVIPEMDGKMEPLHAVYRKSTCLPVITAGLQGGMERLIEWHPQVKVQRMGAEAIRKLDPTLMAFFNINIPEDLQKAEEWILRSAARPR